MVFSLLQTGCVEKITKRVGRMITINSVYKAITDFGYFPVVDADGNHGFARKHYKMITIGPREDTDDYIISVQSGIFSYFKNKNGELTTERSGEILSTTLKRKAREADGFDWEIVDFFVKRAIAGPDNEPIEVKLDDDQARVTVNHLVDTLNRVDQKTSQAEYEKLERLYQKTLEK